MPSKPDESELSKGSTRCGWRMGRERKEDEEEGEKERRAWGRGEWGGGRERMERKKFKMERRMERKIWMRERRRGWR